MSTATATVASKGMTATANITANPSAHLTGKKVMGTGAAIKLNYRKGQDFAVEAVGFNIIEPNITGRKLKVEFIDTAGNVISWLDPHQGRMTSRFVAKEWVEKMAEQLGQTL